VVGEWTVYCGIRNSEVGRVRLALNNCMARMDNDDMARIFSQSRTSRHRHKMHFVFHLHYSLASQSGESAVALVVDFGHVRDQLDNTARVAPLVVVPRDELDEVGVQGDARSGVEDGRVRVSDKVGRDDRVLGVAEDALCGNRNGNN
jgi:hypothetical protein